MHNMQTRKHKLCYNNASWQRLRCRQQ